MPRTWEPRERRLVSEWTRLTWPHAHVKENVRLGALNPALQDTTISETELRALGVFRRWVDALVIEPGAVHLVEGKIRNVPGALEQLALYKHLLPLTPELQDVRHLPITSHLVWVIPDPVVELMARDQGVLVHVYHPAWVDDYLKELGSRKQRASQPRGLPTLFTSETEGKE